MSSVHHCLIILSAYRISKLLSHIFDIDGTLTRTGYDLWFLTMKELCEPIAFNRLVLNWNVNDRTHENAHKRLVDGLNLLKAVSNPEEKLFKTAKRLTLSLIHQNIIPNKAILTLRQSIQLCDLVVLNTANFTEAAKGFTAALLESGLITQVEHDKIVVLATNINWDSFSAQCFNVGDVKIHTYYRYLQSQNYVVKVPDKVFVDDPFFSDASLVTEALQVVLIDNPQNRDYSRNVGFERVFWV